MPKLTWNTDRILGISAMFISILTLIVFIYQTRLIRKEQHLSVYPYISYGAGGAGTGENKLFLSNTGIGPALIKNLEINYKKVKFNYIHEFVDYMNLKDTTLNLYYSSVSIGSLIPADKNKVIIGSLNDTTDKLYTILTDSFDLKIQYESIYGEKWITSSSKKMNGFGIPSKE